MAGLNERLGHGAGRLLAPFTAVGSALRRGLTPLGFVSALRRATYRASQRARGAG